ncbi:transposase [Bathymodiolus platifrons methanotrophic gill symbiont]
MGTTSPRVRSPWLAAKEVGERTRDVIRQICVQKDIKIISGVVSKDHVQL